MSNYSVGSTPGAPATAGASPQAQGIDQTTLQVLQANGIDPSTLSPQQLQAAQQQVQQMMAQQGAQAGAPGAAAGPGGMASKMMASLSGGDGGNTLGIALNSGMNAMAIGKAGGTLGADQLIKSGGSIIERAKGNLPIADALQQQSIFSRLVGRIPLIGQYIGPDAVNATIGGLSKEALNGVPKAEVTRIVLANQGNVAAAAKELAKAGVSPQAVSDIGKSMATVTQAGAEKLAQSTATAATKQGAQSTVTQAGQEAARAVVASPVQAKMLVADVKAALPTGAIRAGFKLTPGEISRALKAGTDADKLYAMGLSKAGVKSVMNAAGVAEVQFAETGAKTVAKQGAEQVVKQAATTESHGLLGGLTKHLPGKGIFGKLLSGAKGNFVVAGLFSLGSNAVSLATGKMNLKQFIGLTALDTAAYGGIGMGAAAIGGVFGGPLGFVVGLGVGMAGGWLYDKFIRKPVKGMLGPVGGSAPAGYQPQPGVQPQAGPQQAAPQGPAAAQTAPAQAPAGAQGSYQDPYAQQSAPAPAQAPAADPYAQAGAAPTGAATSQGGLSYDDAMKQLGGG